MLVHRLLMPSWWYGLFVYRDAVGRLSAVQSSIQVMGVVQAPRIAFSPAIRDPAAAQHFLYAVTFPAATSIM